MRSLAVLALSTGFAALCMATPVLAGNEPTVSVAALSAVEKISNNTFAPEGADPWDLVGPTRGTYIPGYGALFTFELSLANVAPMYPFHPELTPQEIKADHDRKVRKLVVLKTAMRELLGKAAASLTSLPAEETVSFEVYFFNFSFEDRTGLPRRLTMSASRRKLLDAIAHHATDQQMASLIEEKDE